MNNFFNKHSRLIVFACLLASIAISIRLLSIEGFLPIPADHVVADNWPYDQKDAEEITLSDAWSYVDLEKYDGSDGPRVGILDDYIYIELENETVRAKVPYPSTSIIADFIKFSSADLQIYQNTSYKTSLFDRALQLLPILIILSIVFLILGRGASKSLGLSSSYDVVDPKDLKEGFDDVAGIDNARADVEEIVQFLKDPTKISSLGGRMPRGALFAGPPGTGKTLLARALAKEAGVSFITIDASSVNQIFVGAGSMKLRRAFKTARKLGRCIIFIDEIDAMGRARSGTNSGGASDEKETTLNTLLVEMDGFDPRDGIFVIAATNRADILDPALTRAGRFDRKVEVSLPDIKGRAEILAVHLRDISVADDIDAEELARSTYGFSGADLALLSNEAAIVAALRGSDKVCKEDFVAARDKILIGRNSSNRTLTGQEREITAWHEAGHALIAHLREHADPIERVTILPHGSALGFVMQVPNNDRMIQTRAQLLARLDVTVAGRVAETMFGGEDTMTTGVQSDVEQATQIARNMVQNWAMSQKGFVSIGDNLDPLHRGKIDTFDEVSRIIDEAIARVTKDLTRRKSALERVAVALLDRETLNADQIEKLTSNRKI